MKLDVDLLPDLALGAVFLATGGGGDPYVALLSATDALKRFGEVELIQPQELADDAYVVALGGVGAPSVGLELLPSTEDPGRALAAFEAHAGRRVDALVSFEIGGGNSILPIIAAAQHGIPVVDGDGMGRALPEAQMMTFPMAGVAPTPALALDYEGNITTFSTPSTLTYERHVRHAAQAMGGMIITVEHPMNGAQVHNSIIPGTLSFSIALGRTLREQRGVVDQLIEPLRAIFTGQAPYGRLYGELFYLYRGKVVDYASRVSGGFDVGKLTLESFDAGVDLLRIDVKNEFLVARQGGRVLASVPDLIVVLDYETGTPINAERLRFGQRVAVLGIGCPDFYRKPEALAVVAPRCFGFDLDYVPLEQLNAKL